MSDYFTKEKHSEMMSSLGEKIKKLEKTRDFYLFGGITSIVATLLIATEFISQFDIPSVYKDLLTIILGLVGGSIGGYCVGKSYGQQEEIGKLNGLREIFEDYNIAKTLYKELKKFSDLY